MFDLPDFFTGVLSRAKLLLHLRFFLHLFNFLIFPFLIQSLMFLSTLLGVLRSSPELFGVGHFVVIQFNLFQVSCWSDWILWWVFSAPMFVNLVFPSFFWSSCGYVGFVFCVELRIPFSCFHYPSFVRWRCDSHR